MSKYFRMTSSAKYCAALCLVGCFAFVACERDADFVMPVDEEETAATDDSEYEAWVQSFSEEMKKSGSISSDGVVMIQGAAGTTGSAPAFTFAAVGTTGAVPTFNFNAAAAATTGSAPSFNFNAAAAATTGDAPAFNFTAPAASNTKTFDFGAAATTSDSAPAFDFANFAKKATEERAAKEAAEKE